MGAPQHNITEEGQPSVHCHICDKILSEAEIQQDPTGRYEPCSFCMEIILDAAYTDGFVRPDDADGVSVLDDDILLTELDEDYGSQEHAYV